MNPKNRRIFLKNSLIGVAGLASSTLFGGCSSFDENLFDDRRTYTDEVMIVGGGISGLYLAYKLRETKTEFRLFEGGHAFGGRIKSHMGMDYGASVFSKNDILTTKLADKLSIQTAVLSTEAGKERHKDSNRNLKKNMNELLYLPEGMQALSDALFEKVVGLLPYRNFKLRWRLIEIHKFRAGYELLFENPAGQKRIYCTKVVLAIPPTQWSSIKGLLSLPEMVWAQDWLRQLNVENTIKIILPVSAALNPQATNLKDYLDVNFENLNMRQIFKKNKATPQIEIDVRYLIKDLIKNSTEASDKKEISIDYISNAIKKKLQLSYPIQKLSAEYFYDWSQVKLIAGSAFKNDSFIPNLPNPNFQIIGDFVEEKARYTIEGALQSAKRVSELLL